MGEIFAQDRYYLDMKQFSNSQREKLHVGLWFFVNRLSTIDRKIRKMRTYLHQV